MSEDLYAHPKPQRTKHFIKEWRKKRGFTQEELADLIGVSSPTISQIENYKTGYTGETLTALADALSVTRGDLLENDPSKDSTLWTHFQLLKDMEEKERDEIVEVLSTLIKQKNSI